MAGNVNNKRKVSKKQKRKRKLILFAVELVVLLLVLVGLFAALKLSKLDSGNEVNEDKVEKNELTEETQVKLRGYTTVALFGLDNRSSGNLQQGNSDVIIIACINNDTKEVKMASIYRDTYLNLTDNDGYNKANAAYAYGGADQAISMLNVNLDLDIKDYVTVDFNSVTKAVDLLGGVEIEITDEEELLMRGYLDEVSEITGVPSKYLGSGGTYNLDGVQATAYARIRHTLGDDYKRTERQRLVISKMVDKALASDLGTINKLVDEIFPDIRTSLSLKDILLLVKDTFSYHLGDSIGFPFDKRTKDMPKAGDSVIPLDLASNVKQLHQFLFDDNNYTVTPAVQNISDEIVNTTGYSTADIP